MTDTLSDISNDAPEKHDVTIRAMRPEDAGAVLAIYAEGIATGHATFATAAPDWQEFSDGHLQECRLIAAATGRVAGWAALSGVSSRCVYRGVGEVSVYVAAAARGLGIGAALLTELVRQSEDAGIWTLQAGIFPENAASIRLHERAGFEVLGLRRRLGMMEHGPLKGQWRDVAFLERRSERVGI